MKGRARKKSDETMKEDERRLLDVCRVDESVEAEHHNCKIEASEWTNGNFDARQECCMMNTSRTWFPVIMGE